MEHDYSIDIKNAASRFKELLNNDAGYDDAFKKISKLFDLSAFEMDQLEKLVPYKGIY